jgi:hypothetical protein
MVSSAILSTDISIINTIPQVNVINLLSYNMAIVDSVKGVGREGHPAWQAIGKRGQAVGKQLVKAGGDYVRGGICSPWAAGNLLALHRGELPDLVRRELIF